jgi:hypothetical protein
MTETRNGRWPPSPLRIGLGMVALLAFASSAFALWAGRSGRLDAVDLSTAVILCSVAGVVALGLAVTYTPGAIPSGTPLTPAEKSLSWRLVYNVVLGLLWTGWGTTKAANAFANDSSMRGYVYVALVLLWLYLSPAILMGWTLRRRSSGPDPDAELNRAFRARATASGFWALLACGAVAYLISLHASDRLPYFLPFSLWLGGSVACIHFVWLHRRAEQDLGDDG